MTTDAPQTPGRPDAARLHWLAWLALWALVLAALCAGSSSTALREPDEGRNAEVAREMLERGDFVTPHLNGLPYLDKPVLLFVSAAAAMAVLGQNEFAVRFPSLFFSLATVLMIAMLARSRFDADSAGLSALMLATSPLALGFAHIVIFDAAMMFWVSAAAIAFHLGWNSQQRRWHILGWAAAGLAVLTKGPVGLVLPLLIAVTEALACGHRLRRMFHPAGLLVFVLVVAPWFLAVTSQQPEFPHYAFVRETLERVATDRMNRTAGIHYVAAWLLGGALPWSLLLLAGWQPVRRYWAARKTGAQTEIFLLAWIVVPLVFFTLSQSKRPGYILVSLPAVALLCARLLRDSPRAMRATLLIGGIAAAIAGVALLSGSTALAARLDGAAIAEAVRATGPLAGAMLLAAAAITLLGLRIQRVAVAGLALLPVALVLGLQGVVGPVGESRSARSVARAIEAQEPAVATVVAINTYPASLSFYLRRTVLVATGDGSAIRSNYIEEYAEVLRARPGSTLRPADWWRTRLDECPQPTVFVVDARHPETVAELAARLPAVHGAGRYLAYGPCAPAGA